MTKNYTPANVFLISDEGKKSYIAMVAGRDVYRLDTPLSGEDIVSALLNGGDTLPIMERTVSHIKQVTKEL